MEELGLAPHNPAPELLDLSIAPPDRCGSSLRATASPIFIKTCIYTISEYVFFCFEGITSFYLNPTHYVGTNLRGHTGQATTGKQKQVTKGRTVLTSPLVGPFSFC